MAAPAGTAWQQEMGDVYFALLCLANETGVDLDSALEAVLAKHEGRLARTQDAGSGR